MIGALVSGVQTCALPIFMSLAGAAIAMGAAAMVPATPAAAQSRHHQYRGHDYDRGHNYRNYDRRDYRRHYNLPSNQRCDQGDGGTTLGAIAGGLPGPAETGRASCRERVGQDVVNAGG